MYVTAHRVRDQVSRQGFNAFLHMHGGFIWTPPGQPPDPSEDPGTLVNALLSINPTTNNVVLSYLDIVAPDDYFWPQLRPRFLSFVNEMRMTPFPWSRQVDGCLFQAGMVTQLAQTWKREMVNLYRACEIVHPVMLL